MNKEMAKFFGDKGIWRNPDNRCTDDSTINTVDIYHVDRVERIGDYAICVKHCRSFPHGRGFMASYESVIGHSFGNGRFYKGTDIDAYNKALNDARVIANNRIKEDANYRKEVMS